MHINKSTIIDEIKKYYPSHIIIGYSGGIDSSVLLNILNNLLNIPIIAIHINHNINKNSLKWEKHCEKICKKYNIQFISHLLNKPPARKNFENWASKQRVKVFQKIMKQYCKPLLLLGHHKNDQAETFLMQAIRGSGLSGLSGISYYKKLHYGILLRPLLNYTKYEITEFAKINNIKHIYDNSNKNIKYRRNFIRNKIIPILEKINPNIIETISRNINICKESNIILNKIFKEKLQSITQNNKIIINKLMKLDINIQKSLIYFWFKTNTKNILKNNQIKQVYSAINSNPITGWKININKKYQIHIEYNCLIIKKIIPINTINNDVILEWLNKNLKKTININKIIIRNRMPGDRCKYYGRNNSTELKKIFQELHIPTDKRLNAKIIIKNQKIIAVYPFFICNNN